MTGAAIVVLCVFVFAAGWLSCAAVSALAGDRQDARLRARLPRCGMTASDGSERRTCSCLGPVADIKQLSLDLRTNRLRDLPARPLTESCDPPDACVTHGRCWTHSDWASDAEARAAIDAAARGWSSPRKDPS
jgi:hypothetical protein